VRGAEARFGSHSSGTMPGKAFAQTSMRFRRPADFSITEHLGDSFGVFKGKASHRVRIHFDVFAAQLVSERQWHTSQKLRLLAGGELELSMDLGSLEEIERWVLSWGEHATVLEPPALKRQLRRTAEAILKS
jgi:proteasome accessory factor B